MAEEPHAAHWFDIAPPRGARHMGWYSAVPDKAPAHTGEFTQPDAFQNSHSFRSCNTQDAYFPLGISVYPEQPAVQSPGADIVASQTGSRIPRHPGQQRQRCAEPTARLGPAETGWANETVRSPDRLRDGCSPCYTTRNDRFSAQFRRVGKRVQRRGTPPIKRRR